MKLSIRDITFTALFTTLIIIGSFIKFYIFAVPITLQFVFTNFSCLFLGKKLGSISILVYISLGLLGFPVFAGGGGLGYILTPTFGYIIGFAVGGFLAGFIMERYKSKRVYIYILASLINLLVVDSLGTIYFILINSFYLKESVNILNAFIACFISTLPKDIILSILTSFFAYKLNKIYISIKKTS